MDDRLGPLLRRMRTRAGLTQERLAELSGVSVRTIRRLETGRAADHRLGTVSLLADALGADAEDRRRLTALLGGAEAAEETPPPRRPEPSAIQRTLAAAAAELAREVRHRWRREEEQRRVHDPFPLPVRWQDAPAELTDHWENVQRLGPGAVASRVDLCGDLHRVADVYRKVPSRRLLVLGRGGSGKSVLTIRFLLDVLDEWAVPDPVPVIFSVGSWDPATTPLRDWLVGRLLRDHPHLARRVPSGATLAAALVDADLVLPVLDGFDEIAEGLRGKALDVLNGTSWPLVVTSRRAEYADAVAAAGAPLVWAAGIELTDVTLEDLAGYLPRTDRTAAGRGDPAREGWEGVLARLRAAGTPSAEPLARVLSTPLMVSLARTLYGGTGQADPAELLDGARFPTERDLEEHLLAGFVPAVYRDLPDEPSAGGGRGHESWEAARAQHWLGHLAHHLSLLDRDRQDLAWWHVGVSLRRSTRITVLALASGLCVALVDWVVDMTCTSVGAGEALIQGLLLGLAAAVAFGSVHSAMVALGAGVFEPSRVRLGLRRVRGGVGRGPGRTSTIRFAGVLGGTVMGVGWACAAGVQHALYDGASLTDGPVVRATLTNMLCFGVIIGAAAGVVFWCTLFLETPFDVAAAATPVRLLHANRATVLRQFAVQGPALAVLVAGNGFLVVRTLGDALGPLKWSPADACLVGAIGGLGGATAYLLSFTAWGNWLVVARGWLPLTGRLPWRTVAFLDDAYRRGVLRQTGAVYQFRHIRLQHHLARAYRERQARFSPVLLTGGTAHGRAPEPEDTRVRP
ncbi:helix-turn-helix transcriptional regulator [Streptomyces sp. NPDC003280]|uniref:helix-turn-helix transcriptional regulator n=1 Tax=Streptomyces sp. NPDC003280 TaxID=3364680 RepID=UPI0036B77745